MVKPGRLPLFYEDVLKYARLIVEYTGNVHMKVILILSEVVSGTAGGLW